MKLLRFIFPLFLLLCIARLALAEEGCGTCILYGDDFAFAMTAPEGWILDNKSGRSMGLHQVFYPKGQTFKDAPAFAYSRARTKTPQINGIDDQVTATIADFKPTSPNIMVKFQETLRLPNGREAKLFFFTGDQWGNFEAAAYINEKKTINFVILSAKNKDAFEDSLNAFRSIVQSYVFISDHVEFDHKEKQKTKAPNFDFTGRSPSFSEKLKLTVVDGVLPGIPVLFDQSQPDRIVLRPANDGEQSNDVRAVYRFEWMDNQTAMFYELYPLEKLKQLADFNAKNIAAPEGNSYELSVIPEFLAESKVLQTCLPKKFTGNITAFFVVNENGSQGEVTVLPEGRIAQCIIKETEGRIYKIPPSKFVAKISLRVNE